VILFKQLSDKIITDNVLEFLMKKEIYNNTYNTIKCGYNKKTIIDSAQYFTKPE